jgi:hypothetical protein
MWLAAAFRATTRRGWPAIWCRARSGHRLIYSCASRRPCQGGPDDGQDRESKWAIPRGVERVHAVGIVPLGHPDQDRRRHQRPRLSSTNRAVRQDEGRYAYGQQASAYGPEHGQIQLGVPGIESVLGRPQIAQVVGWDGWYKQVVQGPGDYQHTGQVQ